MIINNANDFCMICGKGDNTSELLICDKCNINVCHIKCDGLNEIPNDFWYCKKCKEKFLINNNNIP